MLGYYPVSVVSDGRGLNITVQSYQDNLDIGLVSCREVVPDLWDPLGYLTDAIDELHEAASRHTVGAQSPGEGDGQTPRADADGHRYAAT